MLARWFWRLDRAMGGDAVPQKGRLLAARHPIRVGVGVGVFMGALLLMIRIAVGVMPGTTATWGWDDVAMVLGIMLATGPAMTGIAFLERLRQRHYGFFPEGADLDR